MPARIVEVARADEIQDAKVKVVIVDGKQIALCNYAGKIYAIDDVCTHDRGPLDQGELDGNEIECPRHGARFDITTGVATRLPAVRPVRTYPVHLADGVISIEVEP